MYALLPPAVFALVVVFGFWLWRRYGSTDQPRLLPPCNPHSPVDPVSLSADSNLGQLQLQQVKAQGRFGCVWKAQTSTGRTVAVKIFPLQDQQSWLTERGFYSLTQVCCHDNILRFYGSDRRGNEFWLVTEYHDRGSLYDHLKGSVVSIGEAITIALTMCRGLAFLHSSLGGKPIIAHRDFKSRNVLLRSDFSVCIADFGLALVLDHHPGDIHGQVGTRRYMSPEVLDGSINFSIEHFLKIDVYACALVLWEVLSRCSLPEVVPDDYMAPFEDDIGSHPTLEEMQDTVVTKRKRPRLKESWYQNEVTAALCSTIDECWDHDPEARLSAECVEERLLSLWETL